LLFLFRYGLNTDQGIVQDGAEIEGFDVRLDFGGQFRGDVFQRQFYGGSIPFSHGTLLLMISGKINKQHGSSVFDDAEVCFFIIIA
jgi:hypothetical protein